MWEARIPLKPLTLLCRSLGTMLESGVPIHKAFLTASMRIGGPRCQSVLKDVAASIAAGHDLTASLQQQGTYFPSLFIDMVHVSEESGALPEVLAGLADHYENTLRLRRNFVAAIAMPLLQLFAAIFIVAFLIYILGFIAESRGGDPVDVLGLGLTGSTGAVSFLVICFGSMICGTVLYLLLTRGLRQQQALHTFFLGVPVVGHCLRSFAIARFSWAFYLTQQTGMRIGKSIAASMRATSNGAFIGATQLVNDHLKAGDDLTTSLRAPQLFTEDFLQMVHVAETSGTVPEMLHRLSPQFEDQARRSLQGLAAALSWLVWLTVAGLIVFAIFRIFYTMYLKPMNDMLNGM